jgi:hypothetical protein
MNRLTVSIVFQYQHARSFRVIGIVFDHHRTAQAVEDVTNRHAVCGELLVAVIGNTYVAVRHERAYQLQGLAQFLDPFWFLIIPSGVRLVPLTPGAHQRPLTDL